MGFDKLSAMLGGKSVLERSIEALSASPWIGEMVLVCPEDRWNAMGSPQPKDIPFHRVDGGAERQDSVLAGLNAATLQMACVHDGARPLVAASDIDRCIAAALADGAATLAHRVADTLRRGDSEGFTTDGVDREYLWAMETPQCAEVTKLRDALESARRSGASVTDETSALAMAGVSVKLVESAFPNPKITTPADLKLALAMIS
jgi:2-C-methyl-D-erythritol 4-phosphate cytidylyltransferase